ncbi:MAG TPA: hypothetical protein DCY48_04890 [Candidatus Magasanikbacteria bacterium]|nr:MAG: hypothetical protein A3I74_03370 [Candidatus Magasanikbacteria bacterium RIFCSPLOWO2_02_FULL_47_16]OGH80246.1 MAG: hypothetical protein A3C10_03650 [Candidatus Magasanikbacteria bacterium RIFCSPHIGHO2_02_FULL_48_18]OGH82144.1 MAG: hypothetical protein A3G08_02165 [Candidatus Magasanikbacteria bacterium RIFCSPLOWO2_12_FULL_47_9b]HAZ29075.1 hypothetical protein [Candidatus Magasanikbacteria bacterium]
MLLTIMAGEKGFFQGLKDWFIRKPPEQGSAPTASSGGDVFDPLAFERRDPESLSDEELTQEITKLANILLAAAVKREAEGGAVSTREGLLAPMSLDIWKKTPYEMVALQLNALRREQKGRMKKNNAKESRTQTAEVKSPVQALREESERRLSDLELGGVGGTRFQSSQDALINDRVKNILGYIGRVQPVLESLASQVEGYQGSFDAVQEGGLEFRQNKGAFRSEIEGLREQFVVLSQEIDRARELILQDEEAARADAGVVSALMDIEKTRKRCSTFFAAYGEVNGRVVVVPPAEMDEDVSTQPIRRVPKAGE